MNTLKANDSYMRLIKQFPLMPIRGKRQLNAAIRIMKELSYKFKGLSQSEADYLYVLSDLIAGYEKKHLKQVEKMPPVESLKYLMEINGLRQSDLVPIVKHKSNLSAFLHGKRSLSKLNAINLGQYFQISPATFLQ